MRGIKRKTNTREHKDLQSGQIGVQFEEVAWNRADLVTVQIPKRKKGWNEMDKKEKQGLCESDVCRLFIDPALTSASRCDHRASGRLISKKDLTLSL